MPFGSFANTEPVEKPPKKEKPKRVKPQCHLCESTIEGKAYKDDQGLPYCYTCAAELQLDSLIPKQDEPTVTELVQQPNLSVDPILYELKPTLETLVQMQTFWSLKKPDKKGWNIRTMGPRLLDVLKRIYLKTGTTMPDEVAVKVLQLQTTAKRIPEEKKLGGKVE